MTVELAGWVLVGLVVLTAVIGVVPRRFKEVGGPAHGAHAKVESDTPVSRRTAWHDSRYVLLMSGVLAIVLLTNTKHLGGARIAGLAIVAIGAWDLLAWLRLRDPAERARAWSGLRIMAGTVLAEIAVLLGGWPDDAAKLLFVLAALITLGPEFDHAFRRFLRRRSGSGEAPEPP